MCVTSVLVLSLSVFFFKQKTAYEMRISDWSSDVCSSDLACAHLRRRHRFLERLMARQSCVVLNRSRKRSPKIGHALPAANSRQEIGRASCRESVCQYV